MPAPCGGVTVAAFTIMGHGFGRTVHGVWCQLVPAGTLGRWPQHPVVRTTPAAVAARG
ncbi:hypothetical protein FRAHR75_1480011 [Frankia sp. Hr75.2]|nr:hypothetical protein FRAHR75_1480011 [Frankia sp. Hr75.2]